jgi:hypothetical protein
MFRGSLEVIHNVGLGGAAVGCISKCVHFTALFPSESKIK